MPDKKPEPYKLTLPIDAESFRRWLETPGTTEEEIQAKAEGMLVWRTLWLTFLDLQEACRSVGAAAEDVASEIHATPKTRGTAEGLRHGLHLANNSLGHLSNRIIVFIRPARRVDI